MRILIVVLIGLFALASCADRMKIRGVDFERCLAFVENIQGNNVIDSTIVIRSYAAYADFQKTVSGRYFADGSNDCSFPTIDFSKQVLIGSMIWIYGHEVHCEESAWYSSLRNELMVKVIPVVEESGDNTNLVVEYFIVEGMPRMDFEVIVERG